MRRGNSLVENVTSVETMWGLRKVLRKLVKMWNEWTGQAENGGVSVDKFSVVYDERGWQRWFIHTTYDHQSYNHTIICFGMVLFVDNQCSCCNVLCVWEIFATFAAKALLKFWEYINLQRPFKSNYDICQKNIIFLLVFWRKSCNACFLMELLNFAGGNRGAFWTCW